MSGRYDDIIKLSRPVSKMHPPMPMEDRAAQFSPFAALTGFCGAVRETSRLTEKKQDLDEESLAKLDERIARLKLAFPERPPVSITYFVQDEKKAGGRYLTQTVKIRRIDEVLRILFSEDGKQIRFDDISAIESDFFGRETE